MGEGRIASGFPCPECGSQGEHTILSIQAMTYQLHCLTCEATWWVHPGEEPRADPS